jgi:hypothetical protein
LLYACSGSHIGLGRVFPNAYTVSGELTISTSPEVGRLVKLHPLESVLEVFISKLQFAMTPLCSLFSCMIVCPAC